MSNEDNQKKIQKDIDNLKSKDVETRQSAAWNLYKSAEDKIEGTKSAIPALKKAINDKDWAVRKLSIIALAELQVRDIIPQIIDYLRNDAEAEVRVGSAQALGILKAENGIPFLIKALDDSSSIVKQVTVAALAKYGLLAKAAVPKLIEILKKPEDIEFIQINNLAAYALGEIGDKRAIEPLIAAYNEAAYHERKVTIATSLFILEGKDGFGYTELERMKENHELAEYELETYENLKEKYL